MYVLYYICTYVRIALVVCVSELFKLVRYTRIVTVRARHIVLILIKYNFVCLVFMGRSLNARLIYASQQATRVDRKRKPEGLV